MKWPWGPDPQSRIARLRRAREKNDRAGLLAGLTDPAPDVRRACLDLFRGSQNLAGYGATLADVLVPILEQDDDVPCRVLALTVLVMNRSSQRASDAAIFDLLLTTDADTAWSLLETLHNDRRSLATIPVAMLLTDIVLEICRKTLSGSLETILAPLLDPKSGGAVASVRTVFKQSPLAAEALRITVIRWQSGPEPKQTIEGWNGFLADQLTSATLDQLLFRTNRPFVPCGPIEVLERRARRRILDESVLLALISRGVSDTTAVRILCASPHPAATAALASYAWRIDKHQRPRVLASLAEHKWVPTTRRDEIGWLLAKDELRSENLSADDHLTLAGLFLEVNGDLAVVIVAALDALRAYASVPDVVNRFVGTALPIPEPVWTFLVNATRAAPNAEALSPLVTASKKNDNAQRHAVKCLEAAHTEVARQALVDLITAHLPRSLPLLMELQWPREELVQFEKAAIGAVSDRQNERVRASAGALLRAIGSKAGLIPMLESVCDGSGGDSTVASVTESGWPNADTDTIAFWPSPGPHTWEDVSDAPLAESKRTAAGLAGAHEAVYTTLNWRNEHHRMLKLRVLRHMAKTAGTLPLALATEFKTLRASADAYLWGTNYDHVGQLQPPTEIRELCQALEEIALRNAATLHKEHLALFSQPGPLLRFTEHIHEPMSGVRMDPQPYQMRTVVHTMTLDTTALAKIANAELERRARTGPEPHLRWWE